MKPDVYVLMPTFREPDHVRRLLEELAGIRPEPVEEAESTGSWWDKLRHLFD